MGDHDMSGMMGHDAHMGHMGGHAAYTTMSATKGMGSMPMPGMTNHDVGISGGGMDMAMTFHQTTHVTLLFGWWKASGFGSYLFMLAAVFGLALLYEWALLARRRRRQAALLKGAGEFRYTSVATSGSGGSSSSLSAPVPAASTQGSTNAQPSGSGSMAARDTIGAVMYAATQALGFVLMLATMTYNVGIFLSVVAGLGVGHLLWGHLPGGGDTVMERAAAAAAHRDDGDHCC